VQFSLLAGLFRYFFSKTEVHILILGLDHAGKTVSFRSAAARDYHDDRVRRICTSPWRHH
jgi:hypothetical protein